MPGVLLAMSPKGKTCIPKGQFFVKAVFSLILYPGTTRAMRNAQCPFVATDPPSTGN